MHICILQRFSLFHMKSPYSYHLMLNVLARNVGVGQALGEPVQVHNVYLVPRELEVLR